MVKIIRFLCIAGIILLLGLFVSYTEFGYDDEKKEISENKDELLMPEELSTDMEKSKGDSNVNIFSSQKVIKLIFF
jgi:cbb3-type cytochrome oxidase subunit 3